MAPTLRQTQRQAPKTAVHLLGAFNVERGRINGLVLEQTISLKSSALFLGYNLYL